MGILEATALADAVLIIEDDVVVADSYRNDLEDEGIEVFNATDKSDAFRLLEDLQYRTFERMVVILDLMFQPNDFTDGVAIMKRIHNTSDFKDERLKVIVCTGTHDIHIINEMLALGALKVYQKGIDPSEMMQQVQLQLGREVLTRSLLFGVVDVNTTAREIEIAYASDEGDELRAIVDLEFAPVEARVPGGSFWCDFYKKLSRSNQLLTRTEPRPVEVEEDDLLLEDLLGTE